MSVAGYLAEGVAIESRFSAQWADQTLVAYDNAPFLVPGSSPDAPPKQDWVRFQVLPSAAGIASIGGPTLRYRHDGDVVVEIYTLPGLGTERARSLADTVCGIFRAWQIEGLRFFAPRVVVVGARDGWYRLNVIAPYQRESSFPIA